MSSVKTIPALVVRVVNTTAVKVTIKLTLFKDSTKMSAVKAASTPATSSVKVEAAHQKQDAVEVKSTVASESFQYVEASASK